MLMPTRCWSVWASISADRELYRKCENDVQKTTIEAQTHDAIEIGAKEARGANRFDRRCGEARRLGDEKCRSQQIVTYPCLSLKELTKKFRLSSRTVSDVQSRGMEVPAWGNKWILLRRDRMGMMLAMRSPLRMVRVSLKSRWLGAGVGRKGENHST
jgi:hypothetical protein